MEKTVFFVLFSEFFRFLSENFSDFCPNLQKVVKTTFFVSRGTICGLNLFSSFESLPIFCRNHWHGSQISIYLSRVKIAEGTVFWFFFSDFFRILREKFFRLSARKLQKLSKLPSTCPEEQFVAWNFFLKFWIVFDFLQKPSAWFSNFYPRVQSKNCGRNSFLIFLFRFFSAFERKLFQTFGQKTSKSCQN